MMDGQVMFWMTFGSSGLLGNKQPSTTEVLGEKSQRYALKGVIQLIDAIKFMFPTFQVVYVI